MRLQQKYIFWLVVSCFFWLTLFLTLNRHNKSGSFNYHSEIWGDKAGYYMYLPATFKFNFKANNFPKNIDLKTGNGFTIDQKNNTIKTRYTYGVAILQMPFFLLSDLIGETLQLQPSGFSPIHHLFINIASISYLLLGFLFLGKYLKNTFKTNVIYLVLLTLFLGTNLFYYSIDETGMSHVYSFALFSIYLYLLQRTHFLSEYNLKKVILIGLVMGLILLVRPSNIIFLSLYFFLNINKKEDIIIRLKRVLSPSIFIPIIVCTLIIISPQLIYWKYAFGSFFHYSYGNACFNWSSTNLLLTWFSPNNGLFSYTPFYFLFLIASIYMVKKKLQNGWAILLLFFGLSYVLSCWFDYKFGCAFGARSYVEYLTLFSIPLAHLLKKINTFNRVKIISSWLLIFALITFNLKMTYSYDGCFYGEGDWDWRAYYELVLSPTK